MIIERNKKRREAEIRLVGSFSWMATCVSNEVFEFIREDQNSNKPSIAQWRPVGNLSHNRGHERNYEFSILHSECTVLVSLTRSQLAIADFRSCAASFDNHSPTRHLSPRYFLF